MMFREAPGEDGLFGDQLGRRFGLRSAPSFVNRNLRAGLIAITELRDDDPTHGMTDPFAIEDAYTSALHLRRIPNHTAWEAGKQYPIRDIEVGQILIRDLKRDPSVFVECPHHGLHIYIPRAAIRMICEDADAKEVEELAYDPGVPIDDTVVQSLGLSIQAAFALPAQANRMFLDHVMMAITTHFAQTYGGMVPNSRVQRGGLSPRQARRAKDMLMSDLAGDVGLEAIAAECGLSTSHFRRAFQQTTKLAPHQWLLNERVERAKAELSVRGRTLSEIAIACGFADQSHFTRVFTRLAGLSPGRWRRMHDVSYPDLVGAAAALD
jgi:AraC-like DNA-binding protein